MPHSHLDTARFVVTHPEHYCDRPHVLRQGWILLKEAAGQTVDLDRIGPSRHHEHIRAGDAPLVTYLDSARARTSRAVRAIMAGRTNPDPEGAA